jgi:hypothetical protein
MGGSAIFPGVIPGHAQREPQMFGCTSGNDELHPSSFSLETISMPKPDSPL